MDYVTKQKLLGYGNFKFESASPETAENFLKSPRLFTTIPVPEMEGIVKASGLMDDDIKLLPAERPTAPGDRILVFNVVKADAAAMQVVGLLHHLVESPRTYLANSEYSEVMTSFDKELTWLKQFATNAVRGAFFAEEVRIVLNALERAHHELETR